MNDEICKNCTYWIYDLGDDYKEQHKTAIERNKGFCVCKDFFTHTEPDHVCDEFLVISGKNYFTRSKEVANG